MFKREYRRLCMFEYMVRMAVYLGIIDVGENIKELHV